MQDGIDQARAKCFRKWTRARSEFIKHDSSRIDIRSNIRMFPAQLLGRHIRQCPHYARGGEALCDVQIGLQSSRESEIENFYSAVESFTKVSRFQITMNDAFGVRSAKAVQQLRAKKEYFFFGKRAAPDFVNQACSLDKLHYKEAGSMLRIEVMYRCDIRVIQLGKRASFSAKTGQEFLVVSQLGR